MMFRFALTIFAYAGLSLTLAHADGLPPPDDKNFNPVPSVPGVPAPGVPAKPQMPAKPTSTPVVPAPSPVTPTPEPAPAPKPAIPLSSPAKPAPAPIPAGQKQPVHSITSIDVQVAERQPPIAQVTVKAMANTGGWKDIELKPLQTLAKEVGMLSFTLVGTPPDGPATQVMTPVTATIQIDPLPADVKTIRVIGATNEQAQSFR